MSSWQIAVGVVASILASGAALVAMLILFFGLLTVGMTGKSGPSAMEFLAEYRSPVATLALAPIAAVLFAFRKPLLALIAGGGAATIMIAFVRSIAP